MNGPAEMAWLYTELLVAAAGNVGPGSESRTVPDPSGGSSSGRVLQRIRLWESASESVRESETCASFTTLAQRALENGGHASEETESPRSWPDGPTDEVLGELRLGALEECGEDGSFIDGRQLRSPACARLDGWFDLRKAGVLVVPYIADLLARKHNTTSEARK
ncbi:hypothetical protein ACQP1O_18145 [Nocardia sp. CA-151230]|uniref:hypothetical protein n=1 Tax=Nocardia sp. CA-151230 TaxID=3239982 RepID=UPI003D89C596